MDYDTVCNEEIGFSEEPCLNQENAAHSPAIPTSPDRSSMTKHYRSISWGSQTESGLNAQNVSIGNLSIEPGPRHSKSRTSITSVGSGGRKSTKSYKTLGFKGSKDRLREGNVPSSPRVFLREDRHDYNTKINGPFSPDPLKILERRASESLLIEPPSSARAFSTHSDTNTAGQDSTYDELRGSPDIIGSGLRIPTRDSSQRYSHGGSPTKWNLKSHGPQEGERVSLDIHHTFSKQPPYTRPEDGLEDEVSQRIRELKDQKRRRESPLVVAVPDARTPSPSTLRTPRKFSLSPLQPHRKSSSETRTNLQIPAASDAPGANANDDCEESAPSPAIDQRMNRLSGNGSSSEISKPTTIKLFPVVKHNVETRQKPTKPIQRANSRVTKRSISPTVVDKHRRTFSNAVYQPDDRPTSRDSIDDAVDDYLLSPRLSQKICHPQTGRIISFSEVGDPNGLAIFCCVGMGLTRYITAFYDELALTLKLRLITPDRPGVGASEAHADGSDQPLMWPDDILTICQYLELTKFSILAHSAGAIYALATALRMPQHIRGRIHLLAPWIPPSQMTSVRGTQQDSLPVSALPYSQRFLRSLPTTFLKAANTSFFSATSASITTSLPRSPRRSKRKSVNGETVEAAANIRRHSSRLAKKQNMSLDQSSSAQEVILSEDSDLSPTRESNPLSQRQADKERQSTYDTSLTEAIWAAATTNANPAVDLLVCLERRQPIGFRYVDITRSVVIHHGSKDTRVPVENVKWLGKSMRRCEVRVLEGEGHGLMASAGVMGSVLMEMARDWEDWMKLVQGKGHMERRVTATV